MIVIFSLMMLISSLIFGMTGWSVALTSTIYCAWGIVGMNALVYGISHAISDGMMKKLVSDKLVSDLVDTPRERKFKFIGKEPISWLSLLICVTTTATLYQYGAFMTSAALGAVSLTVLFAQAYSLIIALAEEEDEEDDQ